MNNASNPYRNAFGQSPDSFQRCISNTLREVKVGKAAKRISLRVVLTVGLIALLLAGVAYAAITQFGLLELYSSWHNNTLTDQGRNILTHSSVPLAEATFGETTVTVREAIADGHYLYMTVDFLHKDPHALLLGVDEALHNALYSVDVQRYIHTNFAVYSGEWRTEWCDYKCNEDGSLTYVLSGAFPQTEGQLALECLVVTSEQTAHGEELEGTRTRNTFTLTAPVLPVEEQLTVKLQQEIESLGLVVDSLTMTRTPLALYYEVVCAATPTATADQRERIQNGIWIRLLDVQGEPLPDGMSLTGSLDRMDDAHFAISGSLAMDTIPDTIMLELYDGHAKEIYEQVTAPLK